MRVSGAATGRRGQTARDTEQVGRAFYRGDGKNGRPAGPSSARLFTHSFISSDILSPFFSMVPPHFLSCSCTLTGTGCQRERNGSWEWMDRWGKQGDSTEES